MKNSLRIIAIGSIFLLCGTSFFGIVSVNDAGISSNFWNVRQIVTTAHAGDDDRDDERDDDRDDDNDDDRDDDYRPTSTVTSTPATTSSTSTTSTPTQTCTTVYDTVTNASGTATQVPRQSCTTKPATPTTTPVTTTPTVTTTTPVTPVVTPVVSTPTTPTINAQFKDGIYTGVGKYAFGAGSVDYSVSITIASGKISQASFLSFTASGNGKYTRAQGDATLQKLIGANSTTVDTVTGATGTSKAIQDAVNDALSKARTSSIQTTTPTPVTPVTTPTTPSVNVATTGNENTATPTTTTPVKHTAPNGKTYTIASLSTGMYMFQRADGTVSSMKFASYQSAVDFINKNNQNLQEDGTYTAPNGKRYMIVKNTGTSTYLFRRADGSMSDRTFSTREAMVAYIASNNAKRTVTATVKRIIAPVTQKATQIIQTLRTGTQAPAPTSTPSAATQTAAAQAKAQAAAQAAAAARAKAAVQVAPKPVVQTPPPAPKSAPAPIVTAPAPKVDTTTAAS